MRILRGLLAVGGLTLCACTSPAKTDTPAPEAQRSQPSLETSLVGVRFIGLSVSDIDETLAFYQSAVPYRLVRRDHVKPSTIFPEGFVDRESEIEVALVEARNVFVQLVDFDPDAPSAPNIRPVKGPGYTHMCYISPASDSAFPKLREAGLSMVTRGDEPVDLAGAGMRYAYGLDPNGIMIETEVADTPRRGGGPWVGHIGTATSDVDRMVEFYTALLGYGPRRRAEYSNVATIDQVVNYDDVSVRSAWFVSRNLEIEFWEYLSPRTLERDVPARLEELGYNMVAFEVADLDAEIARLGGIVEFSDVIVTPFGWRTATGLDPDGNIFALHERVSAPATESVEPMLWIDPETF